MLRFKNPTTSTKLKWHNPPAQNYRASEHVCVCVCLRWRQNHENRMIQKRNRIKMQRINNERRSNNNINKRLTRQNTAGEKNTNRVNAKIAKLHTQDDKTKWRWVPLHADDFLVCNTNMIPVVLFFFLLLLFHSSSSTVSSCGRSAISMKINSNKEWEIIVSRQ